MKTAIFWCAIFLVFSIGSAQTSLGLTVGSEFNTISHKNGGYLPDNYNNSEFSFQIGPTLRIMLGGDREITPNAGITYSNNSDTTSSASQLGFWIGCGYFFHLVHDGAFTFSCGPDVSYNFYLPPSNSATDSRFELIAGLPLNFDFDFFKRWSVRISGYAFTVEYSHLKREVITDNDLSYSLTSILSTPRIMFFYSF